MKHLQSEQGYTMAITLMILAIFIVLGLSIMQLTLSGANRSESRESNTQAQRLASKGETYLLATIEAELNESIKDGVTPEQYLQKFKAIYSKYKCTSSTTLQSSGTNSTTTGEYEACITKTLPKTLSNTGQPNSAYPYSEENVPDPFDATTVFDPFIQKMTIRSVGSADSLNKEKTVESEHLVGIDLNLQQLEFALTARGSDTSNNDGVLSINGAATVNGSMFAKKEVKTTNSAKYYTKTVESLYPRAVNSKVVTTGNVGNFSAGYTPVKANDLNFDFQKIDVAAKVDNYGNSFKPFCTSTVTTNCLATTTVAQAANSLTASAAYAPHLNRDEKLRIEPVQNTHKEVILVGKTCLKNAYFSKDINIYYNDSTRPSTSNLVLGNNSCLDRNGITRNDNNTITISENGLYTAGNMFVGHRDTYDDSPTKPELRFKGDFYVNENLYFINAKVKTSALKTTNGVTSEVPHEANFYVKGDVYILWSEFINVNMNIYAEGDIHFINVSDTALVEKNNTVQSFDTILNTNGTCDISNFSHLGLLVKVDRPSCNLDFNKNISNLKGFNTPSVFNGLVYSNSNIKFHTATSNITFNGNLSAKNIDVSGIAGQVISNNAKYSVNYGIYYTYSLIDGTEVSNTRYVLDKHNNMYYNLGNSGNSEAEVLSKAVPIPIVKELLQLLELLVTRNGIYYCIDAQYKPFSNSITALNNVFYNTASQCPAQGSPNTFGQFIADEYYNFPRAAVQEKFESRIKFNKIDRQSYLENKRITKIDPSKSIERKIE